MGGNETPGRIVRNAGVGVHDVFTSGNFYDYTTYGVWALWGVKFWASPMTCVVALTTLSHYTVRVCDQAAWAINISHRGQTGMQRVYSALEVFLRRCAI